VPHERGRQPAAVLRTGRCHRSPTGSLALNATIASFISTCRAVLVFAFLPSLTVRLRLFSRVSRAPRDARRLRPRTYGPSGPERWPSSFSSRFEGCKSTQGRFPRAGVKDQASRVCFSQGTVLPSAEFGQRRHAFSDLVSALPIVASSRQMMRLYGRRPRLATFQLLRITLYFWDGSLARAEGCRCLVSRVND